MIRRIADPAQAPVGAAIGLLVFISSASAAQTADIPFAGVWKANPAKARSEVRMIFAQSGNDSMTLQVNGQTLTFKFDGKETPYLRNYTSAWTQVDPHTWRNEVHRDGQVTDVEMYVMSADGKTLTMTSTPSTGDQRPEIMTMKREAGKDGLIGRWVTERVQNSLVDQITITPLGDGGLELRRDPQGWRVNILTLDGKAYPVTGSRPDAEMTYALQRNGLRSFTLTQAQHGKVLISTHYTLSADGRTLTGDGRIGAPGTLQDRFTNEYDRVR